MQKVYPLTFGPWPSGYRRRLMICRCGGQHDCLLIWRSEFESRCILQLLSVKFVFEEDENKQKEAGILKVLFAAHSMPKRLRKKKNVFFVVGFAANWRKKVVKRDYAIPSWNENFWTESSFGRSSLSRTSWWKFLARQCCSKRSSMIENNYDASKVLKTMQR